MHPHELARAERTVGALAPYRWEAWYRNGGRLLEHDVDGHHHVSEIDLSRLAEVRLRGHPAGVIAVRCPVPPDEVILRAKRRGRLGPGGHDVTRWILVGFRYGAVEDVLAIDDAGRLARWSEPVTDVGRAAAAGSAE